MKTIQMTIDESLLSEVDKVTNELKINRSAFIRSALKRAIKQYIIIKLEKQHAEGYIQHPVEDDEFDVWETEQVWEEE